MTAMALGARVIASAGASSQEVRALGDVQVVDYRDPDWQARVSALTSGHGVAAAVNAARGQASAVLNVVASGGRLATLTGDPPASEREIRVSNFYIRADGEQLGRVTAMLRGRTPIRSRRVFASRRANRTGRDRPRWGVRSGGSRPDPRSLIGRCRPQRVSPPKKVRMSDTRRSGVSIAAKCSPVSKSDQWTIRFRPSA